MLLMARTTKRRVDPRVHDLARTIESLRVARGVSKRQLAIKSGVDQSHLGKFIAGEAGLSLEQTSNVLQVLEAALAVDKNAAGTPAQLVGTISAKGEVSFLTGGVVMPGAFRVDGNFGEKLRAGDTVIFEAGDWSEGRIVIVEHEPGDWRAHKCETRNGLRFLVTGDAILFNPDRHKILGVALERRERL